MKEMQCSPFCYTPHYNTDLDAPQSCCSSKKFYHGILQRNYIYYHGILQRNNRKMTMPMVIFLKLLCKIAYGHFPIIFLIRKLYK